MRVLLIRLSSLGDVAIQTSVLNQLKLQYPHWKIDFLTHQEFASLLAGHEHIHQVYALAKEKGQKGFRATKEYVRKNLAPNKYDLIIDLHANLRSFMVRFFLWNTPSLVVDKRRWKRALFIWCKLNCLKKRATHHRRFFNDFKGLVFDPLLTLEYPLSSLPRPKVSLEHADDPYIILAPVASFAPKRWPIESFKQLSELILNDPSLSRYKVISLAGPKDDYCQELTELEETYSQRFYNLQGKTSLAQTRAYLAGCEVCVGNDTGLGHIAEAYGRTCVTIFGPTHEDFGFRPHLERSRTVSVPLWCRPCSATGKKKCFRKEQFCMHMVTPQMVLDEMKKVLLV